MSSDETPRGLIQGIVLTSEINQSAVNHRARPRRSGNPSLQEFFHKDSKESSNATSRAAVNHASPKRGSLSNGGQSSNKRARLTPKLSSSRTPEVSARIAVRNRFLRSSGRAEVSDSARKFLRTTAKDANDPTPRVLIQGFLNNAAPETPAVHRLDSPPTENFALPGIYDDEEIETHKGRPLSPLVDTDVSVGSRSRLTPAKLKHRRQGLSYKEFHSGVEKRMKEGHRVQEEATAELENDNNRSTLEELAETEVILSSSPLYDKNDESQKPRDRLSGGTPVSRTPRQGVDTQPDTEIPDFQISNDDDDESISGDELAEGNTGIATEAAVEEDDENISGNDVEDGHTRVAPDEEFDGSLSGDDLGEGHTRFATEASDEEDDGSLSGNDLREGHIRVATEASDEEDDGNLSGDDLGDTGTGTEVPGQEDGNDGSDVGKEEEAVERSLQPTSVEPGGFADIEDSHLGEDTEDATEDYSELQTPRISPRAHKTPVLTERKRRQNTQMEKSPAPKPKPVRKPRSGGSRKAQNQPPLPTSLTKSIFCHFSTARVSKEALAAVEKGSEQFFKRLTTDLSAYCKHAHRQTVEMTDIELLMKRQGLITSKRSLQSLIEEHLPMEYRRELIPMAYAGNVVKPKK